ncbi:MAG: VOC family protein [Anaerolineae bacterium]|nr:VOC family protein [Anaerolineae bacterium]
MLIKRLAHLNIISTDLAASEHFYCTILGLEKAFEFHKEGELFGFYIKTGDMTFIEIFTSDEAAKVERPLIHHLCLETDDLDAVIASVRAQGGAITDKKRGTDQSWQAWTTDPNGVAIEIMQYTEDSSQYTGRDCIVNW